MNLNICQPLGSFYWKKWSRQFNRITLPCIFIILRSVFHLIKFQYFLFDIVTAKLAL